MTGFFCPLPYPLHRFSRLVAVGGAFGGYEPSRLLAVSGYDDFLALLSKVEKLAQLILRLEGADLSHHPSQIQLDDS